MIICLIRHGQTEWNSQRRIQGRTDNPLNDVGRAEAKKVAEYLKIHDPHWDHVFSSPLARALETGKIIARQLDLPDPIIHQGLIERQFGVFEGTVINENTFPSIMKEQVPGLESKADLQARVLKTLREIAESHPGEKILIATHSHFIKGLLSTLLPDFNFGTLLKNAAINYFEIQGHTITLRSWNIDPE